MAVVLAALIIFFMRLTDVSLGTLRIVMLVRGRRRWAGLLGFFESLILVVAIGQVISDLNEPVKMFGYAAGFAAGTVLGATVERWLAMGTVLVRVVSSVDSPQAFPALHDAGFPVTVVNGEGREGEVRIVFSVVRRRQVGEVLDVVAGVNPDAFVTVEEALLPDLYARKTAASMRK